MKKTLLEDLKRIHSLTYGQGYLTEDNYLDTVLQKAGTPTNQVQTVDDPKKADLVGKTQTGEDLQGQQMVDDYFKTLDSIDYPLFQQNYGQMKYQKEIEAVQIGLELLGYDLPRFGVDGLFGPETAMQVNKFKKDNNVIDYQKNLNEAPLESPVDNATTTSGFGEKRSYENHGGVDLATPSGTPVKSPADGIIIKTADNDGKCGGTVIIDHGNGFTSGFCHLKQINVNKGDQVKQGQVIALSGGGADDYGKGNATGPHLHYSLKKDGQYVNPLNYFGKEVGTFDFKNSQEHEDHGASITPEMVDVMIKLLHNKNVTPDQIKYYLDPVITGGSDVFTDVDLNTQEGFEKYKKIADTFIQRRNPNAGINGEMIALGAKQAYENYHKLVPPELALAQLAAEGGLSTNPKARPITTNNPFDVGNTETKSQSYPNKQLGINAYFNLIARSYMNNGKTATSLLNDFSGKNGRYAGPGYEDMISKIAREANKIAKNIA